LVSKHYSEFPEFVKIYLFLKLYSFHMKFYIPNVYTFAGPIIVLSFTILFLIGTLSFICHYFKF